ncbi:hypothetical protein AADZ84_15715 [Colwelliaceae bacterium MEBiC 14330]
MDSPNLKLLINFTMAHSLAIDAEWGVHIIRYVFCTIDREIQLKKILFIFVLFMSFSVSAASNNSGYSSVIEVKVWPSYIDIYLEAESICTKEGHKTRYVLSKEENEMYSTLLAAMTAKMVANVNYDCRGDGVAEIFGVRVKPQT